MDLIIGFVLVIAVILGMYAFLFSPKEGGISNRKECEESVNDALNNVEQLNK